MVDSHTHLDVCAPPNAVLVADARAVGVVRMLTVGMDEASNRGAIAAAEAFPETVWAAVGRHPSSATGFDDAALEDLRALASHPRVAAVGETGLDFFRERASREAQEHAFRAQVALAREVDKPLVVHCRDAGRETIDLLAAEADGVRVVLHCFSMPEHLEECVEHGWWCSFAGNVTYPKSLELTQAAARVPPELLLVETDAPFLSPQAVRRERNQPAYVVDTAAHVARAREIPEHELDALVTANAAGLFGW